jgi:hypothetical protein
VRLDGARDTHFAFGFGEPGERHQPTEGNMNPSQLIDRELANHPDWRGETMAVVRRIIRETAPDVTEEWKWMGTPTWSLNGILCICNAFKDMVKVTFINGAKLRDEDGLFNAELGGNKWRAIKIYQGDKVNANGLKKLLRGAVAFNAASRSGKAKPTGAGGTRTRNTPRRTGSPAKARRVAAPGGPKRLTER